MKLSEASSGHGDRRARAWATCCGCGNASGVKVMNWWMDWVSFWVALAVLYFLIGAAIGAFSPFATRSPASPPAPRRSPQPLHRALPSLQPPPQAQKPGTPPPAAPPSTAEQRSAERAEYWGAEAVTRELRPIWLAKRPHMFNEAELAAWSELASAFEDRHKQEGCS